MLLLISEICKIDFIYYKQNYCVIECSSRDVKYKVKCVIDKYDTKHIVFFGEIVKCIGGVVYVEAYEVSKVNTASDIKIFSPPL